METKRQKLDRRLGELKRIRSDYERTHQSICDEILPYRGNFYTSGTRKTPEVRSTTKPNSTPTKSLRIMSAGLMAGITSPSREWFNLTTTDKELKEKAGVKKYLNRVEKLIREHLAQARWYQTLADGTYPDLGLIATAALFLEEASDANGVRFEPLTIGEYWLDTNKDGEVDTCFRERVMTVRQVVQRWGLENVSTQTRRAHQRNHLGQLVTIIHAVFPNEDIKTGESGPEGMDFASCWFEKSSKPHDGFLSQGGYREFPVLAPRWNARADDVYGVGSPGWEALGDCKALQHLELRLARLVDKSSDPPMKASSSMRSQRASLMPGDVTYLADGAGQVYEPAMTVSPQSIVAVEQHIRRHEDRIEDAFFVSLWMAMLNDDRQQRATATEVEAIRQEVMLQLGPLLENLNNGLLEPCINRVYAILERQQVLPPAPPELEGGELKVEFISVMHQAQKLTGVSGIRELLNNVAMLVQTGRTDALDKVNSDAIVDELTDILGIKPELIYTDREVEGIRQQRAEQQQAQQQGDAMLQATQGAKNLAGVDPEQLSDVAGALTPVAGAQAGLT